MGNAESSGEHHDEGGDNGDDNGGEHDVHVDDEYDPFDGIDTLGYRVLGVQPNSPASKAGLVSFLDFLVGANRRMLLGSGEGLEEGDEYDDVDLPSLLEQNKGQPVEFRKYKERLLWLSVAPPPRGRRRHCFAHAVSKYDVCGSFTCSLLFLNVRAQQSFGILNRSSSG